jgi:hypothetical protein
MSFTVTKYPTAYTNPLPPLNWINPANVLNVEDGLCTRRQLINAMPYTLAVSGYGFALPSNAVLEHVYWNHKGYSYTSSGQRQANSLVFHFTHDDYDADSDFGTSDCSSSTYHADDVNNDALVHQGSLTVADLNAENFKTTLVGVRVGLDIFSTVFVDACYIKVIYHLAAAKKGLMDGFIFVS